VRFLTKPHIYEAELDDEAVQRLSPLLKETLSGLCVPQAARAAFPSLAISAAPDGAAYKLQCNEGGCFPLHYDNAGPPNKRQLTALFYLNPGWAYGHGGELQLVPWLRPPVTLAPLHNRLVLFLSDSVLHRVLQCQTRRFCFTIWLDGDATNSPAAMKLDGRVAPTDLHRLDPATRLLSRAVYAEEYAASIADTFADAPDQRDDFLGSHQAHVAQSMANPALAKLVQAARAAKERAQEQQADAAPLAAGSATTAPAAVDGSGSGGAACGSQQLRFAVELGMRAVASDGLQTVLRVVDT
jgi:hypothetical protein